MRAHPLCNVGHFVQQLMGFLLAKMFVEERQINFFFLGEMEFRQNVKTVEHSAQIIGALGVESPGGKLRAQLPQLFGEAADFGVVQAHGRGGARRAEYFPYRRVEDFFFGEGVGQQVVQKEVIDPIDFAAKDFRRCRADGIRRAAQVLDLFENLFVLFSERLADIAHGSSL